MNQPDGRTEMLNDFLDHINDGDYNLILAIATKVDASGDMIEEEKQPVMVTYQTNCIPQQTVKPLAAALLQAAAGSGYTTLEMAVGSLGSVLVRINTAPSIVEG